MLPLLLSTPLPSWLVLGFTSSRKPFQTSRWVTCPLHYPGPGLTMQGVLSGYRGCVCASSSGSQSLVPDQAHGRGWRPGTGGAHGLRAALISAELPAALSGKARQEQAEDSGP